jgi:hypothetical protein
MLLVPTKTSMTPDHADSRYPYLFDPHKGCADISVVFTWDKKKAEDMAQAWRDWGWVVRIGGPAYDDPAGDFCVGKYIKKGVVITHRGCIRNCPWCYVPEREGKIRCLEVKEGNILQDNNILACPKEHQRRVFKMLRTQKNVSLRGGLDARLITDWAIDEIRSLHLYDIWTAYDSKDNKCSISAIQRLRKAGISQDKIRVYCLIGFDGDTISDAEERCLSVLNNGGMPFAQLYDQRDGDIKEWKRLARKWSRPAIYRRLKNEDEP